MSKRIISPWKPLILAFGAILATVTAATLAFVALTATGDPLPFDSSPRPELVRATDKPMPASKVVPRVIPSQVRAQTINGAEGVATPTPQPTPAPTPEPPTPTEVQTIAREPASVDVPPPPRPAPRPPTAGPTPVPIPGGYRSDLSEQLYTLINNERTSRGLAPVVRNAILVSSAEYYVRLVWLNDPYDLTHWLDGGPGDRAWARGYCCGVGEILVESEGSAQQMVELWMDSTSHRNVILDPHYVSLGIACYDGPFVGDDGNLHYPIVCGGVFGSG